jgi:hypothetical protein
MTTIPSVQAWITEEAPENPNPKIPAKYSAFTINRQHIEVYGAQGLPVGTCIQVVASTNSLGVNFFRVLNVLQLGSGVLHPTVFNQISDDPVAIEQAYEEYDESLDELPSVRIEYPEEITIVPVSSQEIEESEEPAAKEVATDTTDPEPDEPDTEAEPVAEEVEAKPKRKRRSKAEIAAEQQASNAVAEKLEVEMDPNKQAYVEAGKPCPNSIVEAVLKSAKSSEVAMVPSNADLYQRLNSYIFVHNSLKEAGIEPLPETIRFILVV